MASKFSSSGIDLMRFGFGMYLNLQRSFCFTSCKSILKKIIFLKLHKCLKICTFFGLRTWIWQEDSHNLNIGKQTIEDGFHKC